MSHVHVGKGTVINGKSCLVGSKNDFIKYDYLYNFTYIVV